MKATTVLQLTRSIQRSVLAAPSASLDEAIAVARRQPYGSPAVAHAAPSAVRLSLGAAAA